MGKYIIQATKYLGSLRIKTRTNSLIQWWSLHRIKQQQKLLCVRNNAILLNYTTYKSISKGLFLLRIRLDYSHCIHAKNNIFFKN